MGNKVRRAPWDIHNDAYGPTVLQYLSGAHDVGGPTIKRRRIYAKEENCMGCGLCEVHCIVAHSRSKDIIKAFKEERPRPIARIRVERVKPTSFGLQCRFCDEPMCVAACLTGGMHLDDDGLPTHDQDKCVGCGTCILFCPFGAIQMDEERGHTVAKCDMCAEVGEPACVLNCPNRALVIVEIDDGEDGDQAAGGADAGGGG